MAITLTFLASMGPRHFSRGIWAHGVSVPPQYISFNGATAFQPWNPHLGEPHDASAHCFNGATAFQPWNRPFF